MFKVYDDRVFPEVNRVQTVNQTFLGDLLFPGLTFPFHLLNRYWLVDHEIPPAFATACSTDCFGKGPILFRRYLIASIVALDRVSPRQGRYEASHGSDTSRSKRCITLQRGHLSVLESRGSEGALPLYICLISRGKHFLLDLTAEGLTYLVGFAGGVSRILRKQE